MTCSMCSSDDGWSPLSRMALEEIDSAGLDCSLALALWYRRLHSCLKSQTRVAVAVVDAVFVAAVAGAVEAVAAVTEIDVVAGSEGESGNILDPSEALHPHLSSNTVLCILTNTLDKMLL